MRPVPGWSALPDPDRGLYLCGAGAHPGGGVTGAPGYIASHRVLRDLKKGRSVTPWRSVPCPWCGDRPFTEFTFGGELGPVGAPDPEDDFARSTCVRTSPAPRWSAGSMRWAAVDGSPSARHLTNGRLTDGFVRPRGGPVAVRGGRLRGVRPVQLGVRTFTRSLKSHRRRGLYCGTGDCANCLVTIDGVPGDALVTEPRDGMQWSGRRLALDRARRARVTDQLHGPCRSASTTRPSSDPASPGGSRRG